MNRRDFAKMTSMGVFAAGSPSFLTSLSASTDAVPGKSPNDRIQLALIGANNQGGRVHLPSLVGDDNCQVVAICDVDRKVQEDAIAKASAQYAEQTGKASYKGIKAVPDFREVMADDAVDAVVIATPDHWHVPIAKAAVLAGKDVYVEKPLSLHIQEGRELVELAKKHGRIVQVGSQQRSDERFVIASEIVKNGLIGDLKHVEVAISTRSGNAAPWEPEPIPPELNFNMWLGPAPWSEYHAERVHYNFRFVPEISGGEIANWGAHFLDTAQSGLGTDDTGPVLVRGMGERNPVGSRHTSFFDIDVDFEYANGVTMHLKTGKNGVTFFGTEGQLYVNRKGLTTTPKELVRRHRDDLPISMRHTKGGHLTNWFTCVRSRRAQDLHAGVEIGHRSATLCHLANIAIELKRPLHWDPQRESFIQDAHANALRNRPSREDWA
ncbi:MAG: Gfo/Idh/MocA family oxidoreductase [Verrucomicrobiae bacterium]|nr:Gfo/Idh/MocA family oxidoreductase [Verrucomicrobiae bacterium]